MTEEIQYIWWKNSNTVKFLFFIIVIIMCAKGTVSVLDPFLTSGLAHPYHLDESTTSFRGFL